MRSFSSEQWLQLGSDDICVFKSNDLFAKYAVAVIKHCRWKPLDAAELIFHLVGGHREWITDSESFGEGDWIFRIHHGVELEPDDGESSRCIFVEEPLIAGFKFDTKMDTEDPVSF